MTTTPARLRPDLRAGTPHRPAGLRTALTYPLLWTIGLGAGFWPLLAVVALPKALRTRMDRSMLAVAGVVVALVLSCGVGFAAGFATGGRLIGVAANVSVWVGVLGLLALERTAGAGTRRWFVSSCVVVATVHSVVALAALAAYPHTLFLPLLGDLAGSLPSGIANLTSRELIDASWLDGPVLRTVGMMAQPTWSGGVAALGVLLTLWLLPGLGTRGRLLAAAAVAVNLVNVWFSYGRTVQLGLVAVVVAVALRAAWRRWRLGPAVVFLVLAGLVVAMALNLGLIVTELAALNDAREGSADARGDIYAVTWSLVSELKVPVLGYGVKPTEDGLVASVATHSTYLGLLFRGGILGLGAFVAFLVVCVQRCCRAASALPVAVVALVALWCVFEDLDSGHLVPLFLVAALFAAGTPDPRVSARADHDRVFQPGEQQVHLPSTGATGQ